MPTNPEDGGLRNTLYKKETRSKRRMTPMRRFAWHLLSTLGVGELRIRREGEEESFAIIGGFVQVRPDKVVVMAETADMASEIDLEKAQEARREAEKALEAGFQEGADLAAARAALQQALLRIRVAERRHREGPRRRV